MQLSPYPTIDALTGVAYGQGKHIAVGASGTVLTSVDGSNWTSQIAYVRPGIRASLAGGVVFGAETFVAVGGAGTVMTSVDGSHWASQWTGVDRGLRSVAFGNGRFVAVGGATNRVILTSDDSTHWIVQRVSEESSLRQVAFGGGVFVAVGSSILVSSNGVQWSVPWSASTNSARDRLTGVAYGAGRFVTAGPSGLVLTSTNRVSWMTNRIAVGGAYASVAFGQGRFVVAGAPDDLWVSEDGLEWARHPAGAVGRRVALSYQEGQFIAVGDYGFVATSPDGLAWQVQSRGLERNLDDVAVGNGRILVNEGGHLLGTADGITWNEPGGFTNFGVVGLSFANRQFLVFGRDNREPTDGLVLASRDGLQWTARPLDSTSVPTEAIYAGDQYTAAGFGVFTSSDAEHWAPQTGPNRELLSGLAYGNGRYVTLGSGGVIYYSATGTEWSPRVIGLDSPLDVAFGNGRFVAVGSGFVLEDTRNKIVVSPDGEHWTKRSMPTLPDGTFASLTRVAFGGSWFVAVGLSGAVFISQDGEDWQARDSGTFANLSGVTYSEGRFVVVGEAGTLLVSSSVFAPQLSNWSRGSDGFRFRIAGQPDHVYRVEAAASLIPSRWVPLGSVTNGIMGSMFLDPDAVQLPFRFYRAIDTSAW